MGGDIQRDAASGKALEAARRLLVERDYERSITNSFLNGPEPPLRIGI